MIQVMLLLNTNRELVSLILNPSLKNVDIASQWSYNDDVICGFKGNLIMSETVFDRRKLPMYNTNCASVAITFMALYKYDDYYNFLLLIFCPR